MRLLDFFFGRREPSANAARERLKLIVVRDRLASGDGPDFLPLLREDLLDVIRKYVEIDKNQIKCELDKRGNMSLLEVNVELPVGFRHSA